MAKVKKLKLSIDLEELFGAKIENRALREAIAGRIIEKIAERTQGGDSLRGNPFRRYSEAYTESLDFDAFGKSETPDLTLTGDMLASMQVIDDSPSKITIGFPDETENAKAFNHNVGDTLPKREFFGIQKQELEEIKDEFLEDALDFAEFSASRDQATALRIIDRLLGEDE